MSALDAIPAVRGAKLALWMAPLALGAVGMGVMGWKLHSATGARDRALGRVVEYTHVMTLTRARMMAVSEQTRANAEHAARAIEAANLRLKQEIDHAHDINMAGAVRAADAYARSHSVRPAAPRGDQLHAVAGDLPGPGPAPGGPDAAREDAVVVSRDDFDVCTENSVKVNTAHEWIERIPLGF